MVKIKKEDINIRLEYELTPIRHLAVQCPECKSWFKQGDICLDYISYSYQLFSTQYTCPKCNFDFKAYDINIEECFNSKEVYRDVSKKKVIWE